MKKTNNKTNENANVKNAKQTTETQNKASNGCKSSKTKNCK